MEAEKLAFDPDALTIGDLEDFEDVVGKPFAEIFRGTGPNGEVEMPAKALKALVWIVRRKEDPSFTLEAARNVRIGAIEIEAARREVLARVRPTAVEEVALDGPCSVAELLSRLADRHGPAVRGLLLLRLLHLVAAVELLLGLLLIEIAERFERQ